MLNVSLPFLFYDLFCTLLMNNGRLQLLKKLRAMTCMMCAVPW